MTTFTTRCVLCDECAIWKRNSKDKEIQRCENDMCLLFNINHVIGSPLPKIIKIK